MTIDGAPVQSVPNQEYGYPRRMRHPPDYYGYSETANVAATAQSAQTYLEYSQNIPVLSFTDIHASELSVLLGIFLECCGNILK